MVSTNLITFELSFQNSTETIIFNNTSKSLNDVVDFLKARKYYIAKVKEFNRPKSAFQRCTLKRLIDCTDHNTELNLILTNKK
jgi:hypothetical protein